MNAVILLILLLTFCSVFGQVYDGFKGFGIYKEYDRTFVSPDLRGKHSISLGGMVQFYSPIDENNPPNYGAHLGYNYLIIKSRKRIMGHKEQYRDEVKLGFGFHVSVLTKSEFYIMANFYNPTFSLKGKFFSWYFFNEFGIGIHKPANSELIEDQNLHLNLSVEFLRLRFGKSPLNLLFSFNYDTRNNLFGKERLNIGFMGGLRYYIFKK